MAYADDLLGVEPPRRRGPGRPKGTTHLSPPNLPDDLKGASLKTGDLHTVVGGVSIPWLVKAFRMGRGQVEEALSECPVLRTHSNGGFVYDLPTAASYLVKPKQNLESYLRRLKANELPEQLREGYWSAKLKEQKWKVNAGELWPTASVLEVLGDSFKTIKTTAQLWIETIDEQHGVTAAQRKTLTRLVDRLMDDLHKALVEQARSNATASQLEELDDG